MYGWIDLNAKNNLYRIQLKNNLLNVDYGINFRFKDGRGKWEEGEFPRQLPVSYYRCSVDLCTVLVFTSFVFHGLFSEIFWISVFALFFSGVTDGVSMVIRQTILQLKTPDHMRGRVSSVNSIFVGSSNELGALESGVAAKLLGPVTAVVFGGTMTLFTVLSMAFISPTFRKLDLTKESKAK